MIEIYWISDHPNTSGTTKSRFIVIIHLVYGGGETRLEIKEKTGKGNITWRRMEKKRGGRVDRRWLTKLTRFETSFAIECIEGRQRHNFHETALSNLRMSFASELKGMKRTSSSCRLRTAFLECVDGGFRVFCPRPSVRENLKPRRIYFDRQWSVVTSLSRFMNPKFSIVHIG